MLTFENMSLYRENWHEVVSSLWHEFKYFLRSCSNCSSGSIGNKYSFIVIPQLIKNNGKGGKLHKLIHNNLTSRLFIKCAENYTLEWHKLAADTLITVLNELIQLQIFWSNWRNWKGWILIWLPNSNLRKFPDYISFLNHSQILREL